MQQQCPETRPTLDKTLTYCYDNIGNITNINTFAYTTESLENTTATATEEYTYDGTLKDRVTRIADKTIYYNGNGNIRTYGSYRYSWIGGKLRGISSGSSSQASLYTNCLLTYNGLGQRTKKDYTYNTNPLNSNAYGYRNISTYTYDHSGRLIREYNEDTTTYTGGSTSTRELIFLYDGEEIIGLMHRYGNTAFQPYYFRKNLQGDVTAIYDASGTKIGEYTYDAWGNCSVTYGVGKDVVRNNPIRYRSYYYDKETNLYYLNARYYDPALRRFLSLDSANYLDPDTPNGLNLYAYCYNDPVNHADPIGCSADTILDIISIGWSFFDFIRKPTWENAGWLALDVVFAVVPFLTGSQIMKAASKLDDISDIGGYMNKFDNVYDSIVIGNDMGRVSNLAFDTGSMIYDGYKPLNALYAMGQADKVTDAMRFAAKVDNARFIMDKFNAGYRIINAGSDGRGFIKMMKSAYGMELRILYRLKYGNKLHKLWWIFNSGRRIIW